MVGVRGVWRLAGLHCGALRTRLDLWSTRFSVEQAFDTCHARDGRISAVSAHPAEVPIRTRWPYTGASQRWVNPAGSAGAPAGNLSEKPRAPNRE